jgi:hypothetical protein
MRLAEGAVEGFHVVPGMGINAEVAYMALCFGVDPVDAAGVTGTAFRTHFFTPAVNVGMEDAPPWTWSSLRHNNYGHHESAAYYYGGEVIPVLDRNAVQNWKLLRFEIDAGRPAIVFGLTEPVDRPVLVTGYCLHNAPLRQVLTLADGAEVEVTGEILKTVEIILVRRGSQVPYRPSDEARRADVLKWAARHAMGTHELVYETSRFYATGASALEHAATFVRSVPEPDGSAFAAVFVEETLRARKAASAFLDLHVSGDVGRAVGGELAELAGASRSLSDGAHEAAASHLERAAAAYRAWAVQLDAA